MADTNHIRYLYNKIEKLKAEIWGAKGPGDRMKRAKVGSPEYIAAKKDYDKVYPEYDRLTKEYNAAITALEKEKKNKEKTQKAADDKKKKEEDIAAAKDEYQRAVDSKDAAAIKKAKTKLENLGASTSGAATTTSGTPVAGSGTGVFADYTLNNDGTVTGKDGVQGIFIDVTDAAGNTTPTFYKSYATARDAFLKQYGTNIAELQQQLLASGYIKQNQIADGTWVNGLDTALASYSYKSVSDNKYNNVTNPMGFGNFIKLKKTSTGTGGSARKYQVITTRGDAKKILNEYFTDLVGGNATQEEQDAFYTELHAAENKAVQTTDNGVVTGSVLTDADRALIAAKVARKRLRGTNVETLLTNANGSSVATDIHSLQSFASQYGVSMTAAEALKYVADGIGQKDYLAKQEERIRLIAKQLHPNLAAHIDAGGTIADIAQQYAYAKQEKLGVTINQPTTDKDIMDAVNKGTSISDFKIAMQQKPEWQHTAEANTVVNEFINKIAKTWGLG